MGTTYIFFINWCWHCDFILWLHEKRQKNNKKKKWNPYWPLMDDCLGEEAGVPWLLGILCNERLCQHTLRGSRGHKLSGPHEMNVYFDGKKRRFVSILETGQRFYKFNSI